MASYPRSLTFSDSAKAAQAAVNFHQTGNFTVTHAFFSPAKIASWPSVTAWPSGLLPFVPGVFALFFQILPPSDLTVTLIGVSFYFLSVILIFRLGQRIYSQPVGLIAAVLFIFNPFFLDYAVNASTEIFFTTQLLLLTYYLTFTSIRHRFMALLIILLMIITRVQSWLVVIALGSLWTVESWSHWSGKSKKLFLISALAGSLLLLRSYNFLSSLPFSPLAYIGVRQLPPGVSQGNFLRGQVTSNVLNYRQLTVKIFYNLYNFLKSPDRLISSPIWVFFLLSLILSFGVIAHRFRIWTVWLFIVFLIFTCLTLPNARYIHPVTALIILPAAGAIWHILKSLTSARRLIMITIFIVLITLPVTGRIFIDYRFRRSEYNLGKPPATRIISVYMGNLLPRNKLILTNLDAWAAWYAGLTTMWFPLSPDLLPEDSSSISYIAITDYNSEDADFALGSWTPVISQPDLSGQPRLRSDYQLLTTFTIPAREVYENQPVRGTILIHRE